MLKVMNSPAGNLFLQNYLAQIYPYLIVIDIYFQSFSEACQCRFQFIFYILRLAQQVPVLGIFIVEPDSFSEVDYCIVGTS
jgi:hypothetical protein